MNGEGDPYRPETHSVDLSSRTTCRLPQTTPRTFKLTIGASTSKHPCTIRPYLTFCSFVGSNMFCIKACDPTITSPDYCLNTFDTEGCQFNMPASYAPNEFTSCLGDNQDAPGGNPAIPATSECTTYTSSLLYSVRIQTLFLFFALHIPFTADDLIRSYQNHQHCHYHVLPPC